MTEAIKDPSTQDYPSYNGSPEFRQAVSDWYQDRFNVSLDPNNEVLSLIGSKEGIAHAFMTFLDPGDIALLPNPGYPVYEVATLFAGGEPYFLPVTESNGYQPDLSNIDPAVLSKSNMLFLNYPNNPTGAIATDDFLQQAIEFGLKHDILICMDAAYTEVYYDGYKPRSILEFNRAKEIAIEFHSLSKTFNMTGWRIGMAVGHSEAVQALGKIKTNIDSGIFKAVQRAGIAALKNYKPFVKSQNQLYQKRRDIVVNGLNQLGWNLEAPKATFYIWAKVPGNKTSEQFSMDLLENTGVLVVPGSGYGSAGEGYFRISITTPEEKLVEAISRLKKHHVQFDMTPSPQ